MIDSMCGCGGGVCSFTNEFYLFICLKISFFVWFLFEWLLFVIKAELALCIRKLFEHYSAVPMLEEGLCEFKAEKV